MTEAPQFCATVLADLDRSVCVQVLAASIETTPGVGRPHRRAVDDLRPPGDFDGMLQFVGNRD